MDIRGCLSKMKIYKEITSYENLLSAFNKARRHSTVGCDGICGKTIKNRTDFIYKLQSKLVNGAYVPQRPLRLTKINYDNIKKIDYEILCFEDQVVEYAIRNILQYLYEQKSACVKNVFWRKREFKSFRALIEDEYELANYYITDIKNFAKSIDVELLYLDIMECCQSQKTIDLINKCLFTYNDQKDGLPLGHVLTTFLPQLYLLKIDCQLNNFYRFNDCYVFKMHNGTLLGKFDKILSTKKLEINLQKSIILYAPTLDKLLTEIEGK